MESPLNILCEKDFLNLRKLDQRVLEQVLHCHADQSIALASPLSRSKRKHQHRGVHMVHQLEIIHCRSHAIFGVNFLFLSRCNGLFVVRQRFCELSQFGISIAEAPESRRLVLAILQITPERQRLFTRFDRSLDLAEVVIYARQVVNSVRLARAIFQLPSNFYGLLVGADSLVALLLLPVNVTHPREQLCFTFAVLRLSQNDQSLLVEFDGFRELMAHVIGVSDCQERLSVVRAIV